MGSKYLLPLRYYIAVIRMFTIVFLRIFLGVKKVLAKGKK